MARYITIRLIFSLVASQRWNIRQMDVKTTFLNGIIEEEVYIEQPQGFEVPEMESHVCTLKKDLYGLKQAPQAWYSQIDGHLISLGFTRVMLISNFTTRLLNLIL